VIDLVGTERHRGRARILPHVDGHDPARPAQLQQLQHPEPHIAEADERDPIGQLDRCAPLRIHQTGERLTQRILRGDAIGHR
jgi:hypothetical protein